jgi:hypothetical protein
MLENIRQTLMHKIASESLCFRFTLNKFWITYFLMDMHSNSWICFKQQTFVVKYAVETYFPLYHCPNKEQCLVNHNHCRRPFCITLSRIFGIKKVIASCFKRTSWWRIPNCHFRQGVLFRRPMAHSMTTRVFNIESFSVSVFTFG